MALSEDELRSAMRKLFEGMTMGEGGRFTGCNKDNVSEFMSTVKANRSGWLKRLPLHRGLPE